MNSDGSALEKENRSPIRAQFDGTPEQVIREVGTSASLDAIREE